MAIFKNIILQVNPLCSKIGLQMLPIFRKIKMLRSQDEFHLSLQFLFFRVYNSSQKNKNIHECKSINNDPSNHRKLIFHCGKLVQYLSRTRNIFMSKNEKKKYSGFPGDCSEEQLKVLDQFRTVAATYNGGSLDPRWDEIYLLRFLRARKFNLKDTQKMWKDYIAWRVKNGVDKLHIYYFPELIQLRKMYPHGYHKHDKKYRPIYIERLGFTNVEEIWKCTTPERLLNYYGMLYESLLSQIFNACTEQKKRETGDGSRVMQTCTILDLKDIKLSNVSAAYKFVKPASEMAQNNYPEILGNMFILNAPFLFTGIWAIVKMWIDDKTKEKIQIFGSNYKKELLKYVDPENLPDFMEGGTCKCKGGCLGINIGPWNPEGEEFFPNCLHETKGEDKIEIQKTEKSEMTKTEKRQESSRLKSQNQPQNNAKVEQ